jgi:hypothetical protein
VKKSAWELLSTVLSARGVRKARNVMTLQQVSMDMGDGVGRRGAERFSLTFFGQPDGESRWAIRLEGHHLSLTYTIEKDRLVALTPSSFSANPNRVGSGPHAGLNTLKREDTVARQLLSDLSGAVRRQVFFQKRLLAIFWHQRGVKTSSPGALAQRLRICRRVNMSLCCRCWRPMAPSIWLHLLPRWSANACWQGLKARILPMPARNL